MTTACHAKRDQSAPAPTVWRAYAATGLAMEPASHARYRERWASAAIYQAAKTRKTIVWAQTLPVPALATATGSVRTRGAANPVATTPAAKER